MTINDIDLDSFDRTEYLHFLQMLIDYFYVQFGVELEIVQASDKELNDKN